MSSTAFTNSTPTGVDARETDVSNRKDFRTPSPTRAWAFSVPMTNLARKCALLAVAEACDERGVSYWGLKSLAEAAGIEERSLKRQLQGLVGDGLIVRYRRNRSDGSRTSDLIVLAMPRKISLLLTEYDNVRGGRIGVRLGDVEPPEDARIVEIPPEPRDRISSNQGTQSGQSKVHNPVPLNQVVDPVEEQQPARKAEPTDSPPSEPVAAAAAVTGEGDDSKGRVVLDCYRRVVGEKRNGTPPKVTPKDVVTAAHLVDEHGGPEIGRRLRWALDHGFWGNKVDKSWVRFAGGFAEIGRQMAEDAVDWRVDGGFRPKKLYEEVAA